MARVGELEAAVMQVMWATEAPQTVRQVLEVLCENRGPDRPLAYTTVMTVMERLFHKGLLARQPRGKAFLYRAAASQADYTAGLMARTLGASADRSAALVHFAKHLSDEERQTLRQALAKHRVQHD